MEPVIRLHPQDDVVIARHQLISGTKLASENVTIRGLVPPGHKVATKTIKQGEPVRRYNQIIGFASADIEPGSHVHVHNLGIGAEGGPLAVTTRSEPTPRPPNMWQRHGPLKALCAQMAVSPPETI